MTTVRDILNFVETLAPKYMKMDWDNVGLLCGRSEREVTKVLVALDPFQNVAEEAAAMGAELILTHHPLIFTCNAVNDDTPVGKTLLYLMEHGIAAINAHTNLDCAQGGVNDVLAEILGLRDTAVIPPTFCDSEGRHWNLLRRGTVEEQPISDFLTWVKQALGSAGLRYVDGGKPVHTVAVGGGHCSDELGYAVDAGCDTFVTADVKYNEFWNAQDLGINLIDAGHFYTENPVVFALAEKLRQAFPALSVKVSENHRDCMKFW